MTREAARDLRVRVRASFEIGRGVGVEPIARLRVREQDRRGEVLLAQLLRRRGDSLVVMLGEHDAKAAAANLRKAGFEDVHARRSDSAHFNAVHSSFLIRATMRNPQSPSGSITAASPSAR